MRILVWNAHGGWADALVRGHHEYLMPVNADGGGGRGPRDWPASVYDVRAHEVREAEPDVVILQRLEELEWAEQLTGRTPGRDLPAIFVEHNTPRQMYPAARHPLAGQRDIPVVHVTHFNSLMWDMDGARHRVIPHGVVDPGYLYTGDIAAGAAVINEPIRRWRVTGTDLLPDLAMAAPIDVFGMGGDHFMSQMGSPDGPLCHRGDLPTEDLHREVAQRRVYLHPNRWTSLGLALLEAMMTGMPVVGVDATEIRRAVPPEAGILSTDPSDLRQAFAALVQDPERSAAMGAAAREYVQEHYALARFLDAWDEALADVRTMSSSSA